MADIVSTAVRSRMMAGIRGKNTKLEMVIRKGLIAAGFRYRMHDRSLPGKPDLVLRRYKSAVLVHGCFWHFHGCKLSRIPSSNRDFWLAKLLRNQAIDERNTKELMRLHWRIMIVWECALRGRNEEQVATVLRSIVEFILSEEVFREVRGEEAI